MTFLVSYKGEHGHSPSYAEMATALGLASKSGVHQVVAALEERGHVRRLKNRARAIEVIRMPGDPPPAVHSEPLTRVEAGSFARYERLDDLVHRHYAAGATHGVDGVTSKALHWAVVAVMQEPEDMGAAAKLRRLGVVLQDAASELVRATLRAV